MKTGKAVFYSVLISILMVVLTMSVAAARGGNGGGAKKCNNGIDDDGDGLIDYPSDPGCYARNDDTEFSLQLICDDGVEQSNDRDTLADYRLVNGDPGCSSPTDSSEIDGPCDDFSDSAADRDILADVADPGCTSTNDQSEIDGVCDDLTDDSADRDELADGSDPGCMSTSDTSEIDGVCDDFIDDSADRDALGDAADPGCSSFSDSSEIDGMCDDSVDDASDSDTLADGADPGCSSFSDTTEADGQCDDTINNDLDGLIDFPTDPGCTSFGDSSELGTVQCDNNADDDLDGFSDFPADNGCSSANDDLENSDSCSDSDGGVVTNVAGNTTGSQNNTNYTNYDVCVSSTVVREYFCSGTQSQSTDESCVTSTTSSCVGGRCVPACNDGIDNDGDNHVDLDDSKCSNANDNDESPRDSCSDTDGGFAIFNAGNVNGYNEGPFYTFSYVCIDIVLLREFYCGDIGEDYSPLNGTQDCNATNSTTSCSNGRCVAACADGVDNDGDTRTDYPNDPGCSSSSDNNELGTAQCDNGVDDADSEDTIADYPDDVGCTGPADNDERNQCNDGLDNDVDGHIDLDDSKCSSADDNDEYPKDSCSDTDGGFAIFNAGNVNGYNEGPFYTFSDICIDSIWLREFFCGGIFDDYSPLNGTQDCNATNSTTRCSAGRCV